MKWLTVLVMVCMSLSPLEGKASDLEGKASEQGVVLRSCQMLSDHFKDAQVVASLNEGDTVEILNRKGGWLEVSGQGQTGWVRMLSIRRGAPGAKASAATEASDVLDMASGRAGSGNIMAATGVRGLDEEELKEAEFNEKELEALTSYGSSPQDAWHFAEEAGLAKQTVPYLRPTDGE